MTQPTNRRFVMEPRLDAEVATINTQLNLKAPLASPALTGTPTSTTAAVDTSTTQIATTAFVTNQAAAATSPMDGTAAVGTSKRYARQDHVHPTDTTRAPLASPALTGTPTSTTAAADTNTTQIATTAYVVGQASATAPVMDGTATVGTSLKYARADHVHPTDTSRSPVAGSSSITTVGTVTSGTWNGTDIALAYGGTNATLTAANGGVVYSNATAMAITAAGTQDQVLKSNGAAAPTWQTLDLTYMPDAAYKKSVKAATTANITLSAPQTIDGIAVVAGDRVLVKNQTTASANGIYVVQAAGWTRATDADTISEIAGATVNVDSGTQGSQLWSNNLKTTDTLGTTAMVWTRLLNTGDNLDSLNDVVITSPTAGQTLAYNGTNWINGSGGGGGVTASATAPASPVNGSAWFDTNDGTLYVYYTDVNGSQWVEVQADSALGSQLATRMSTAESNITALQAVSPNYLLNGSMEIAQRGTSFSNPNQAYTVDRWQAGTHAAATVTQQAGGPTGFKNFIRYQRNSGSAVTTGMTIAQSIESMNSIPLAGKTVTVSFYARAGANYSATSSLLQVFLQQGTGTDQNVFGTYTGNTSVINSSATLTTSWQRFTFTGTVATTTTEVAFYVNAATTGTAGAADYYDITGVQLEVGSMATPFRRNAPSIQAELAACQRYYWRSTGGNVYGQLGSGIALASNAAVFMIKNPVTMRTMATSIEVSNLSIWDSVNIYGAATTTLRSGHSSAENTVIDITVAANPLVQFRPFFLLSGNNAAAYIAANAEL